jgi:nitroreductase
VHPVFFLHRVTGWSPGAYLLPRGPQALPRLAPTLAPGLLWQPVPGSPLLRLADNPALAGTLRTLCCHQALAGDANIAIAMLAEFDLALAEQGPAGYRHLLQEAGLLGQVLYLEAEAAGHRGTGIGCFFDDALHELLGLVGSALQSLYHFTLGTAVDDPRVGSEPPYPER